MRRAWILWLLPACSFELPTSNFTEVEFLVRWPGTLRPNEVRVLMDEAVLGSKLVADTETEASLLTRGGVLERQDTLMARVVALRQEQWVAGATVSVALMRGQRQRVEVMLGADTCGDGVINGGETCDDGGRVAQDGCSGLCELEPGWTCAGAPSVCVESCGDGVIEPPELCDDGNRSGQDGCVLCQPEPGWSCEGEPSRCAQTCGDSVRQGSEACDDGGIAVGDGCSASCEVEDGWDCTLDSPAICRPRCGDGIVLSVEDCDDGNTAAGDGCDACGVELGWLCNGAPSVCAAICGDGNIVGAESCDDGNGAVGDGCGSNCSVEDGWTCTGEPSMCFQGCGDRVVMNGEGCDDGNRSAGDGCDTECQPEPGYDCRSGVCVTVCGDGFVIGAEQCDDGNSSDDDGCSGCQVSPGFECFGVPSRCEEPEDILYLSCQSGCVGQGSQDDPFCTVVGALASQRDLWIVEGTCEGNLDLDQDIDIISRGAFFDGRLRVRSGARVQLRGGRVRQLRVEGGAQVTAHGVEFGPATGICVDVAPGSQLQLHRGWVHGCEDGGVKVNDASFQIENSLIQNNGAANSGVGGALFQGATNLAVFVNNTVIGNRTMREPAGVNCERALVLINSLIWGNTGGPPSGLSPECMPQSTWVGTDIDPLVGPDGRLNPASPCVDGGDPRGVAPQGPAPLLDLDGHLRPRGMGVDLGADEVR